MPSPPSSAASADQSCTLAPSPSFFRRQDRLSILVLFAFSLLLYVVTTGYDFVVDDNLLILSNPYVRSLSYFREIFTQSLWSFRGTEGQLSFYRPLVLLTLLGERILFGLRPAAFHLVNVILNAVVVVLVYRMGKRLWPQGQGALWAGLLFAAHPLHTENVAPVFGIGDLESALFFIAAALLYTRPLDRQSRLPRRRAWAAAGLGLLAILAKESALVLPVLFIFHEHFGRTDSRGKFIDRFVAYAPAILLAGVYLSFRWGVFHGFIATSPRSELGVKAVLLSGLSLLGEYASKLAWPYHLTIFQSFYVPHTWCEPSVMLGGVAVALGAAAFIRFWTRSRSVSFAVLWFFLTLAPVLNVRWLAVSAYAERYLYLPSAAFCWLLGAGLGKLDSLFNLRRRWLLAYALPGMLVAAAAARTVSRLPDWRNDFTLALATVREVPDAAPYHVYLGNAYRARGVRDRARQAYMTALGLGPYLSEAYINLAGVLMDDGQVEGARALLARGVAATPHFADLYYAWGYIELGQGERARARQLFEQTIRVNPDHREALNNLALLLFEEGKIDLARLLLERAVRADPEFSDAHNNLGSVCARQGDLDRAEREFRRAIHLSPANELPYLNLAGLYEQRRNPAAALETYRAVIRVRPDSGNPQFRLGVLALELGLVAEARRALERATELQPASALAHTQLGLAYCAAGRWDEARRELAQAAALNPGDETARKALRRLEQAVQERRVR